MCKRYKNTIFVVILQSLNIISKHPILHCISTRLLIDPSKFKIPIFYMMVFPSDIVAMSYPSQNENDRDSQGGNKWKKQKRNH